VATQGERVKEKERKIGRDRVTRTETVSETETENERESAREGHRWDTAGVRDTRAGRLLVAMRWEMSEKMVMMVSPSRPAH
jgi:hypothetical protein